MTNKKMSKAEMRNAALKKENLRLQRKIFSQEAKIVTLQNELLLRPPFEETKSRLNWESVNKSLTVPPEHPPDGGTNAA